MKRITSTCTGCATEPANPGSDGLLAGRPGAAQARHVLFHQQHLPAQFRDQAPLHRRHAPHRREALLAAGQGRLLVVDEAFMDATDEAVEPTAPPVPLIRDVPAATGTP